MKWVIGALMLGTGIFFADWLYDRFVEPNLPVDWRYSSSPDMFDKADVLYYGLVGLGAITVVAFGARLLNAEDKSPVKQTASPV